MRGRSGRRKSRKDDNSSKHAFYLLSMEEVRTVNEQLITKVIITAVCRDATASVS